VTALNQTANAELQAETSGGAGQLKQHLAQYLEGQKPATRALHRLMTILEWASVGVIVFIGAMYLSINWAHMQPTLIPMAWFMLAVSLSLTLMLAGLHAIILRAFPPGVMPARSTTRFVVGGEAVWRGVFLLAGGAVMAAFRGLFAYGVWTVNWALLRPMIGVLGAAMGVAMVISMAAKTVQKLTRSR
jgi:hypothetical protein